MSEISKMLTLSTAHITVQAINELEEDADAKSAFGPVVYKKAGYGFFIYVPKDMELWEETKKEIRSKDILDVMEYARAAGCEWLMIDRDGPVEDDLTVYEW